MTLLTWGPTMQVGFAAIDGQHKELIRLVNELESAMRIGKGRDVVGDVLKGLVDYTVNHFAFEEDLMDQYGITTAPSHKEQHKKLVEDVSEYQDRFHAGTAPMSTELLTFLSRWLTNHILKTDKALAKELIAKGATATV